ncbi:hypothetical protein DFP72DRAFT_1033891 [Ephemerocybe angulata]|uniref:Integrase core domain-containing protein n=1 Tax=Ephemerocybe angulata TaxID=980116 RepID=A0A8H6HUQ8_9AGAR|nr:hypothetical protein DFP72DRAFT_1033891 [Tulosesus angulatus]
MSINNNPTGKNGYGAKNYPSDDILKAALQQYASERLTVAQKRLRLAIEHSLEIGATNLWKLERRFLIPNVRRPPPDEIATEHVLQIVRADINQRRGTGTIMAILANQGVMLPRDFIRKVLQVHAPEGLNMRFPGSGKIKRSQLSARGPCHQFHADGHEKLGAKALTSMGGVGLDIYGIKDQWSSFIVHLVVVPNNRLADTIGHVYLDMVEKTLSIPITMVTDKGSEVGHLFAHQRGLRQAYSADIDVAQFPPVVQIKSVHNTPIEGLWHWFLENSGRNLKDTIVSGQTNGIFHPGDPTHAQLFNYLWPKVLQIQLDNFVTFWNNHRIRTQKSKPNMSGTTPQHAFIAPDPAQAEKCAIAVEQPVVDALRRQIATSRADSMRFVVGPFAEVADEAYKAIGSPDLSNIDEAWNIFGMMLPHMHM